jgi:DNA polymerase-3 subunit beta
MKGQIQRDIFLENLSHASKFTSSRIGSAAGLQGVYCMLFKDHIDIFATNLNTSYAVSIPATFEEEGSFLIESGKIIEFLSYLDEEKLTIVVEKERIVLTAGKTKGAFPFLTSTDFPLPPAIPQQGGISMDMKTFEGVVGRVLFAASRDLSRPVLSGIKFIEKEGDIDVVATDGFRLSLFTIKNEMGIRAMLVPAEFILEFLRTAKNKKKMSVYFLDEQKMVLFIAGDERYYSRLIDGEFPPYERVIPTERKTLITIDREELIKKIKVVSVFARDHSSIVVCEFKKGEVSIYPKIDGGVENSTAQDCEVEGEAMKVAFNFKFILEFLNTMEKKDIQISLLRPDAPVVLRQKGEENFTHIIMPVRIQE